MSSDSVILEVNHHSYVLLTTDKMSLIDNAQIMRDLNSIPYKVGENLAGLNKKKFNYVSNFSL